MSRLTSLKALSSEISDNFANWLLNMFWLKHLVDKTKQLKIPIPFRLQEYKQIEKAWGIECRCHLTSARPFKKIIQYKICVKYEGN